MFHKGELAMKERTAPEPRCWRYDLGDGWIALAGKTDEDNDILSLQTARPADFWFHVHGMPGSHVVLQGPEGCEPSKELLMRAAAIAAWHSKARSGGICPVSCTQVRHVSKPRGVPAGTVAIDHERKLKVRPALPEGME
jgi:predicted ribosome quality control (RQC) complex YloA/Tae2 family protein